MKKESFKYLYSFKYKNKNYLFVTSQKYPFYFLEYDINTGRIDYPDLNTFLDLYEKFQNTYTFTFKDKLINIKERISKERLFVKPFVKTTSGILALSLALSLSACTKNYEGNAQVTEETIVEEMQKPNEEYDDIQVYLNSFDIHTHKKSYNGDDYYFIKDAVADSGTKQIYIQNISEFRTLTDLDFEPTIEDVKSAFNNNKNIPDEEKKIILKALNNMASSEELKDLDLSVLYINAKRMSINKLSHEEMKAKTKHETVYAYFDTQTGEVFIPSDMPLREFEFIHEALGHGSLAYRNKVGKNLYIYDGTSEIMLPVDNRYTNYSIGKIYSEGGANLIARYSTLDRSEHSFYELFEEEIRLIAAACNTSVGNLLNHKGENFYELMYQNNINYPVRYILESDAIFNGTVYTEFNTLLENLMLDSIYEDYVNASLNEKKEIVESTLKVIENSAFKDGLAFDYPGGTIYYNPLESSNNVKEKIEGVR